jgi:hypothetical protein
MVLLGRCDGLTCQTDYDCSLAGTCTNGQCVCQTWVTGDDCAALNLKPLKSKADFKGLVQPAGNWSRWGTRASVVKDGDTYHMFAAGGWYKLMRQSASPLSALLVRQREMAFECPLSVWGAKSQVLHAVSHHGPLGPYERVGVAIPTEAHNPVLSRATDGTWLIWTCGCPHTAANTSCMREKLIFPGGAEAAWTTTVCSSKFLTGPPLGSACEHPGQSHSRQTRQPKCPPHHAS